MEEPGKEPENTSNFPMENIIEPVPFTEQMKEAAEYYFHKKWENFENFFATRHQSYLSEPLDWMGNTALHMATRANDPNLLRRLLDMIEKEQQRFEALIRKNTRGNTVLHHAIHSKNLGVLDVLIGYKDTTTVRSPQEIRESVDKDERELLLQENALGETPVYRAARCGYIRVLVHLREYYLRDEDLLVHFKEPVACESQKPEKNSEGCGDSTNSGNHQKKHILQLAIACQYMDVAVWLISEDDIREKVRQADASVLRSLLQLLAQMPSCFQSSMDCDVRSVEKLVYYLLPMQRYPDHKYEKGEDQRRQKKDIENGDCDVKKPTSGINRTIWEIAADVLSRINCAIWKFAADEWDQIDRIWEKRRQHGFAKKLVQQLVVMQDLSSLWPPSNVTQVTSPTIQPPNVLTRAIKAKYQKTLSSGEFTGASTIQPPNVNTGEVTPTSQNTHSSGEFTGDRFESPLLLAASTGIKEIVECIIDRYPQAIANVERQQNILHVAVKHRQRGIYRLIKRHGALKWLASQISNRGRTVLHQVARMDYYKGGNRVGVVLQLQDELRWFERVKRAIPPHLKLHSNDEKLKASELFDIEHEEMLKEGREWIKSTAQSCSAVAVLVATVVFAAAYTVPGGVNGNGVPVLLDSPLFLFFTITDVAALACSLVSVMMFLSILTSPFEMENFLKSLPRKLELGFTLLFWSLTITMIAFSSTILLTLKLESNKWTTSLVYGVTFFPVAIFGMMQFPIYMAVKYRMKRVLKNCKKVLPKRFIPKAKKRKYSKILY
ncbi:Ankyrin repeat-containing protein [Spatholobus suberectus]|nr:Ankyrin repeat-containing protein [Spatholobus suberectus]